MIITSGLHGKQDVCTLSLDSAFHSVSMFASELKGLRCITV